MYEYYTCENWGDCQRFGGRDSLHSQGGIELKWKTNKLYLLFSYVIRNVIPMYVIGGFLQQVVIYKHLFNLEKRKANFVTNYRELLKNVCMGTKERWQSNQVTMLRALCRARKEFISMVILVQKRDTKNQMDPNSTRPYTSSNVKKLAASVRGTVGHLSSGVWLVILIN